MAKKVNKAEQLTLTLPGVAPKRGRPAKPDAMSNAERQRRYRQTHKAIRTGEKIAATIERFAREFDLSVDDITRELIRFALCNKNWARTGFPGANRKD